jgi:hypothetical protein
MWDIRRAYCFARVSEQFTVNCLFELSGGKKKGIEKFESLEMVVRPNSVVKFQGFVSAFVWLLRKCGKRKENTVLIIMF